VAKAGSDPRVTEAESGERLEYEDRTGGRLVNLNRLEEELAA